VSFVVDTVSRKDLGPTRTVVIMYPLEEKNGRWMEQGIKSASLLSVSPQGPPWFCSLCAVSVWVLRLGRRHVSAHYRLF
jgi:hypothetical protein